MTNQHTENTPEFKHVTLEAKPEIDRFLEKYPQNISEMTFTNIFAWRKSKNYKYAVWKDHLLLSFSEKRDKSDSEERSFLQPVGDDPAGIIKDVFSIYPNSSFERVEKETALRLEDDFEVSLDKNNSDYVYKVSELAGLEGRKYDAKRNFIKQFNQQNTGIQILEFDESQVKESFILQEEWCKMRDCEGTQGLKDENEAIKEVLCNHKKLGISCIGVKVNNKLEKNKLVGFAIGERLNENTFVEHFEKGSPDHKGIYQFLLNAFAKSIQGEFIFLNREQDLGIKGIRKAKESWQPDHIVEKYIIKVQK